MRRLPIITAAGAASLIAAGMTAAAIVGNGDGPSSARQIAGPSVGPAGQTGDLHYLENPAKPWDGTSQQWGPYRLLPAGTRYIERPLPPDRAPHQAEQATDPSIWRSSPLAVQPPAGFTEKQGKAVLYDGQVGELWFTWVGSEGTVNAGVGQLLDWRLPMDVYLYYDDSPLVIRPVKIEGFPAIIEEPRAGPAPNVGRVEVAAKGKVFVLRSPDIGQDRLESIAAEIVRTQQ